MEMTAISQCVTLVEPQAANEFVGK